MRVANDPVFLLGGEVTSRKGYYNVTWGIGDKIMERSFPAGEWTYRWVQRTPIVTTLVVLKESPFSFVEFSPPCSIEFVWEEE